MTGRALAIALALCAVIGLWVRQSEIVVLATQITESVPTIPALATLIVLLAANSVWRRIPGSRPLSRGELLSIFLFVGIASMVMGIGVVQFLIALIAYPMYDSDGSALRPYFPHWLVPPDPENARLVYERALDGRVPWNVWIGPGIVWCGFFLTAAATLFSLMGLFYRSWAEDERLSFPLLEMPLELASEGTHFFRNPVMWGGFAVATLYNGANIAHALSPSWPEIGRRIDLNGFINTAPWTAAQDLYLHLRPELVGLGYLVSTDISLTIWVTQVVEKLGAVAALARGYEPHGLYTMNQGIGAYLTLAAFLVYMARRRLRETWQREPRLFVALGAGYAAMTGFAVAAGMAPWVPAIYFALVLAVALVYGRLRAQTGVPMVWLFPYFEQKQIMMYTLSSAPFAIAGGKTLAVWTLLAFLSRGYFQSVCGYQVEGLEVARREGLDRRKMVAGLLLAVVVGFAVGWYNHLVPYHKYGALNLRGQIWGEWIAGQEDRNASSILKHTFVAKDTNKIAANWLGCAVVVALSLLRFRFPSFPLNPFGYAMSCCFGETMWFSFFLVWLFKTIFLHYGGIRLYRKTIPFFLGLALGHFVVAGVIWGLVGAFSGEAVQGYPVYFG